MSDSQNELSFCMKHIGVEPKLLSFFILVKAVEAESQKGSILMPDSYRESIEIRQNIGLIIAKGPTAFTGPHEDKYCEIGDWIHYSTLDREAIYPNGHRCHYITDDRIYAILKPEEVKMYLDPRK
jgi:hypothetical protein